MVRSVISRLSRFNQGRRQGVDWGGRIQLNFSVGSTRCPKIIVPRTGDCEGAVTSVVSVFTQSHLGQALLDNINIPFSYSEMNKNRTIF